jgi:exodeoxyribonuclease VII large subunit
MVTPSLWDDSSEPTWSVSEIGEAVTGALRRAFPDEVWLRGEIRNLKRGGTGMVWFDLVEPAPGGDLGRPAIATLPVVLFDTARRRVNTQLRRAGGAVRMEDGTEVRIRGRIGFWAPGGRLQVQMTDIDPAFTLGRLAADRERLVRQLEAEGLLGRQKRLVFPLMPLRLGLVTSAGSAAEQDVLDELRHSGIGFKVRRADARVQGRGAPRSVAAALRAIVRREVDVVLLVRGGGSATDLSAFDSEAIARAIAELPVPVVTGIGHEIDRTLADELAHLSFKTPTAGAQAMVAAVRDFDRLLVAQWVAVAAAARDAVASETDRLRTCARHVALGTRGGLAASAAVLSSRGARLEHTAAAALDRSTRQLERAQGRVETGARVHLRTHGQRVESMQWQLVQRGPRVVEASEKELVGLDAQVRAFDPVRTLARGWSITRRASDRTVVRSADTVTAGDELLTTLGDGTVTSTVRSIDATSKEPENE